MLFRPTKSTIDNKTPKTQFFSHVKYNPKKAMAEKEKQDYIRSENKLIEARLKLISKNNSLLPKGNDALKYQHSSLNGDGRRMELQRISKENLLLHKRLCETPPTVDFTKYKKERKKVEKFLSTMSRYSPTKTQKAEIQFGISPLELKRVQTAPKVIRKRPNSRNLNSAPSTLLSPRSFKASRRLPPLPRAITAKSVTNIRQFANTMQKDRIYQNGQIKDVVIFEGRTHLGDVGNFRVVLVDKVASKRNRKDKFSGFGTKAIGMYLQPIGSKNNDMKFELASNTVSNIIHMDLSPAQVKLLTVQSFPELEEFESVDGIFYPRLCLLGQNSKCGSVGIGSLLVPSRVSAFSKAFANKILRCIRAWKDNGELRLKLVSQREALDDFAASSDSSDFESEGEDLDFIDESDLVSARRRIQLKHEQALEAERLRAEEELLKKEKEESEKDLVTSEPTEEPEWSPFESDNPSNVDYTNENSNKNDNNNKNSTGGSGPLLVASKISDNDKNNNNNNNNNNNDNDTTTETPTENSESKSLDQSNINNNDPTTPNTQPVENANTNNNNNDNEQNNDGSQDNNGNENKNNEVNAIDLLTNEDVTLPDGVDGVLKTPLRTLDKCFIKLSTVGYSLIRAASPSGSTPESIVTISVMNVFTCSKKVFTVPFSRYIALKNSRYSDVLNLETN
eukprot:TRINITY_DN117_c0_g1_i1.p1 TRINITY_DN117_c0_g1~~TRINITY_DN117_c0_g1_i1.p1  ORF type:complete len:678 (+),score=190.64 TRINITY_DN117_c0_g1_i1:77-2110(+)